MSLTSVRTGYRGLRRVAKMSKGDLKIDVIEPYVESAVLAVSQFWTTLLMNYFTADELCVMYPDAVFAGVGGIPARWLTADGALPIHTAKLVNKYVQRGYKFVLPSPSQPIGNIGRLVLQSMQSLWAPNMISINCAIVDLVKTVL